MNESEATDVATPPSAAVTIAAPLVLTLLVYRALHVDAGSAFEEGGVASWLAVLGIAIGAVLVAAGARAESSARGTPLIGLGVAAPATAGFLGTAWGFSNVASALAQSPLGIRHTIAIVGSHEALRPIELGTLAAGFVAIAGAASSRRSSIPWRTGCAFVGVLCVSAAVTTIRFAERLPTVGAGRYLSTTLSELSDVVYRATAAHTEVRLAVGLASFVVLGLLSARLVREVISGGAIVAHSVLAGLLVYLVAGESAVAAFAASRMEPLVRRSFAAHLDAFAVMRLPFASSEGPELVVVPGFAMLGDRRVELTDASLSSAFRELARPVRDEANRRVVALAIDERVTAAELRALVAAARHVEVTDLELRGIAPLGAFDQGGRIDDRLGGIYARALLPIVAALRIPLVRPGDVDASQPDERVELADHARVAMPPALAAGDERPLGFVQIRLTDAATPLALVAVVLDGWHRKRASYLVESFEDVAPTAAAPPTGLGFGDGSFGAAPAEPAPSPDGAPPTEAPPEAPEPVDPSSIRRVFAAGVRPIRRCYEAELVRHPDASGRASAELTIGEAGRITELTVTSDTLPARVTECIERELRRLEFPAPPNGTVRIRYPFVFEPAR